MLRRTAAFVLPVVLGIAIAIGLVAARDEPKRSDGGERARAVRVLEITPMDAVPRAEGFGEVAPATTWHAVAEVRGRIVERHPRLEAGALLTRGEILFRVDPTSYQLAIARIEADIRATEAAIAENRVTEDNTVRSLDIEVASLDASEAELKRLTSLLSNGSVSRSQVDEQRRATLAQRQSVQQQRNALAVLPARRRSLEAQAARQQAELASARLDLDHTTTTLPLDARIASVGAQMDQYVVEGTVLVTADGIARAEVSAQLPIGQVRGLIAIPPDAVFDPTDARLVERMNLTAAVYPAGLDVSWPAKLVRFDPAVDPQTRTVGVIVAVDEPYRRARPGARPPLVKGMFTRVVLRGQPMADAIVIPAGYLVQGAVWVADGEDRLRRRPVVVKLAQPGFTVIDSGLGPGDRLVLSDLVPAIEGMLLAPQVDRAAAAALSEAAAAPLR